MTPPTTNGSPFSFGQIISFDKIEGFEVCWAGPHPTKPGHYRFGSTDGRLLAADASWKFGEPSRGAASGEAINGVAFDGTCLAISTREDITFLSEHESLGGKKRTARAVVPSGAHGIVVSPSGYFIAPLGLSGLLIARQNPETLEGYVAMPTTNGALYVSRVAAIRAITGKEVLICALRHQGVGVVPFQSPSGGDNLQTANFPGLDIVDVCSMGVGGNSLAAVAVGGDGTLILFTNVLTDKKPITMKFGKVTGKAYRVLSCRGHVFLLTSTAMYVMANLATRVLWGESMRGATTSVLVIPMEAVDATLIGESELLVVLGDNAVFQIDLAKLEMTIPESLNRGDVQQLTPTPFNPVAPVWGEHRVGHEARKLVAS